MKELNFTIIFVPIIFVVFLSLIFGFEEAGADSMGWGWCAQCGQDRKSSHDFTHGAGSGEEGSGYSSTTTSPEDDYRWQQQQEAARRALEAEKRAKEKVRREKVKKIRQQKIDDREQRKAEIIRKDKEARALWEQEKVRKTNIFKTDKKDLMSSLEGSGDGMRLKNGRRSQKSYHKTLEIDDVPLRLGGKNVVSESALREEEAAQRAKSRRKQRGLVIDLARSVWDGIIDTKNGVVDWVKLRTFEETFNQIPIVSRVRSIQQTTKGWHKNMSELLLGVYKGSTGNFQQGVDELDTGAIYSGTDVDGGEKIGNKARERAGDWVSSEMKSKGAL